MRSAAHVLFTVVALTAIPAIGSPILVTSDPPVGEVPDPFKTYVIKIDGAAPVSLSGNQLKSLQAPPGAKFTLTNGPVIGGVQMVIISSVSGLLADEPDVTTIGFAPALPSSTATVGIFPAVPGVIGYESLIFTGLSTDTAAAGSLFSIGLLGGPTASYTTMAGDTYSTIYSNLLLALQSDGINAFEEGTDLTVVSTITNPGTGAGAVTFTSTDPTLEFNVEASGTVIPEPASLALAAIGIVGLLGYGWRRFRPQLALCSPADF